MNSKIFRHVIGKLHEAFSLARWEAVRQNLGHDTALHDLPWTPKRQERFIEDLAATFDVEIRLQGNVMDLVNAIDTGYASRFWGGGVWQPRTDTYQYTGWGIVDEINKRNPRMKARQG